MKLYRIVRGGGNYTRFEGDPPAAVIYSPPWPKEIWLSEAEAAGSSLKDRIELVSDKEREPNTEPLPAPAPAEAVVPVMAPVVAAVREAEKAEAGAPAPVPAPAPPPAASAAPAAPAAAKGKPHVDWAAYLADTSAEDVTVFITSLTKKEDAMALRDAEKAGRARPSVVAAAMTQARKINMADIRSRNSKVRASEAKKAAAAAAAKKGKK